MTAHSEEAKNARFEINGTEYGLVKPYNFKELVAAIEVKSALEAQVAENIYSIEKTGYDKLLGIQQGYIQEFLNGLGDFDKRILISNIAHFLQKYNLRVGELERLIGVSTGYLSRTARDNSAKKLSIDVVWKLARLFGIDIRTFVETNLSVPKSNSDMVIDFLDKLCRQTINGDITWKNRGGVHVAFDDSLKTTGLFVEEEDGSVSYQAQDHMNPDIKFVLTNDVYTCSDIFSGKEFAMIGFSSKDDSLYDIDFVLLSKRGTGSKAGYYWEKAIYPSENPFRDVHNKAEELMDLVESQELDVHLTKEVRNLIADYLK